MEMGPSDIRISQAGMLIISGLLTTLSGTVVFLFRLLMVSKDAQYAAVIATKDAQHEALLRDKERNEVFLTRDRDALYATVTAALMNLELAVNMVRESRGLPPFEHSIGPDQPHGPTDAAALGEKLAAISKAAGLPAPPALK